MKDEEKDVSEFVQHVHTPNLRFDFYFRDDGC